MTFISNGLICEILAYFSGDNGGCFGERVLYAVFLNAINGKLKEYYEGEGLTIEGL